MRRTMHGRGLPAVTGKELMLINELGMEATPLKDNHGDISFVSS